jgi:hypothetical protein
MSEDHTGDEPPTSKPFIPSEYTRANYPDLFSDTKLSTTQSLDRGRFEYHLETLTSRKQEQEFEEFCRRIAQLEICPNLKPQTGPTGGGDSKTDASTYPVAPALAGRAWFGSPNPPSPERWVFAFSTKKAWKSKLKEDAEKIAGLKQSPAKMFFITSQFARDKDRGFLESEIAKKYGFEVHILDRTWIVNTVIEHKREAIAIQALGITGFETHANKSGPRDTTRQQELNELLARLGDPGQYEGNDYALAQDYRQAALLSRGLERPRHDVDGLFETAMRLARKFGYDGQILRIGYDYAWTSFWWYDDALKQERIYSEIENCIVGTADAELGNLLGLQWRLLKGSLAHSKLSAEQARIDERLARLMVELERLAQDESRPNNALQAQTEIHLLELFNVIGDKTVSQAVFEKLRDCLRQARGLGTYPALDVTRFLIQAGEVYGTYPGYEQLFDDVRSFVSERNGETEEGKLYYERAMQLLDLEDRIGALKALGKAKLLLFRNETLSLGIRVLLVCADVYDSLGLHWASRMEAINAAHASVMTQEHRDNYLYLGVAACLKLAWIELRLGRVMPFLAWNRLAHALLAFAPAADTEFSKKHEEIQIQEGVFGCLVLRMEPKIAAAYRPMMEVLGDFGLPSAKLAFLFAMGDTEYLEKNWPSPTSERYQPMEEFFSLWKGQPATEELPTVASVPDDSFVRLETTLFEVRYVVSVRNQFGPTIFSENLLGVLEAALATAKWENLAFVVDTVELIVDCDDSGENPPVPSVLAPPNPQELRLLWKPDMLQYLNGPKRSETIVYLESLLLRLLLTSTIDPMPDLERELQSWHTEQSFSRALSASPISIQTVDLIGEHQYGLPYWSKRPSPPTV